MPGTHRPVVAADGHLRAAHHSHVRSVGEHVDAAPQVARRHEAAGVDATQVGALRRGQAGVQVRGRGALRVRHHLGPMPSVARQGLGRHRRGPIARASVDDQHLDAIVVDVLRGEAAQATTQVGFLVARRDHHGDLGDLVRRPSRPITLRIVRPMMRRSRETPWWRR